VGAGGHFRRPQRGQEDGMTDWQVFGLPLQLQMHFMNLLLHIFLPNFEHYFVNLVFVKLGRFEFMKRVDDSPVGLS